MELLIHDIQNLDEKTAFKNNQGDRVIVSEHGRIIPCIGCFGCWIKTPAQCVTRDKYNEMGVLFSKAERLTVISQCFYGCYSPFIHNVLERSISYLHPYFKTKNGETHHVGRYDNNVIFSVHFYGNISKKEKETAEKLVVANGINFFARETGVHFYNKVEDVLRIL